MLKEITLSNIDKNGDDHFKVRREERLNQAVLEQNILINSAAKENNIPKEELLDLVSVEAKARVNKNITKVAPINTTYAVVPIGILYAKYKDKTTPLIFTSSDSKGFVYYLPITKNVASTLMLVNNKVPQEWRRAHSTRDIPESQIEIIPLEGSDIIIDLERIISEVNNNKKERLESTTFNISELPYETDGDYRPKRDGKQTYFKLKIFDKNKFPIITTSGTEYVKNITVKADSPNAAAVYASKLTGKKNGLKPWEVKQEGTNLIFKNIYTTLGFDKEGNYKGMVVKESILKRNITLLEQLTKLKVSLV